MLSRVATWLVKFLQNIFQRRQSYTRTIGRSGDISFEVDFFSQSLALWTDEVVDVTTQIARHLLDDGITLGMHCGIVERIVTTSNAQEACRLLEGLRTHAWHIHQLSSIMEGTMLGTIIHNILSQQRAETRDIGQQMLGCRIDIHTHLVHTVLHGLVEALLEFLLIDILLILSHTDGIGIDLDKFGKRVHQSSSD